MCWWHPAQFGQRQAGGSGQFTGDVGPWKMWEYTQNSAQMKSTPASGDINWGKNIWTLITKIFKHLLNYWLCNDTTRNIRGADITGLTQPKHNKNLDQKHWCVTILIKCSVLEQHNCRPRHREEMKSGPKTRIAKTRSSDSVQYKAPKNQEPFNFSLRWGMEDNV